jgi:hypothetical protein
MLSAAAPPYSFDEFQRRAALAARRRARALQRAVALALATSGALFALGFWVAPRSDAPRPAASAVSLPMAAVDPGWLELLPSEPARVQVGTRAAVESLQVRIAWIDDAMSEAQVRGDTLQRLQQLHAQREQMMDSLVRLRYAEQLALNSR